MVDTQCTAPACTGALVGLHTLGPVPHFPSQAPGVSLAVTPAALPQPPLSSVLPNVWPGEELEWDEEWRDPFLDLALEDEEAWEEGMALAVTKPQVELCQMVTRPWHRTRGGQWLCSRPGMQQMMMSADQMMAKNGMRTCSQ